ncbi:MAG: hypothetical protein MZU95_04820 [Desulfomicrobium escambiense]|nr:hypothetical protein [Desulfomicrobium escambiense]
MQRGRHRRPGDLSRRRDAAPVGRSSAGYNLSNLLAAVGRGPGPRRRRRRTSSTGIAAPQGVPGRFERVPNGRGLQRRRRLRPHRRRPREPAR